MKNDTQTKVKNAKKMEIKVLNYWDSVQTRSGNKVMQEKKYRDELRELRLDVGIDVVRDYIFGNENDGINSFLEAKEKIDEHYVGKRMDSSIDDEGNYVYSENELEEIEYFKSASL